MIAAGALYGIGGSNDRGQTHFRNLRYSSEIKEGWHAAEPGIQTIRLIFGQPQRLRRICVVFEESERKRTQEFTLRWAPDQGSSFREIVRRQWNFSSPDATRETEDLRC